MKRIDRYTLASFIGPFIMIFIIVMFVLVLQFLWLYIDDLVGKGLSFEVILEFMGWGACTLIPLALPLATLLASIMTLGGMGESNELLSLKAAGVSLPRILSPLIVVAVIISIGAFFVSNNLLPVAYNKIYTLQQDIMQTKDEIKIPTGIFYDGIEGYTIKIRSRNEDDMMFDVMVYDHTAHNGNTNFTEADSARMNFTPDKDFLVLKMYSGTSYQENNKMYYRDTVLDLKKVAFTEQTIMVPLKDYAFKRTDDDRYKNEVMSQNLKQLSHERDSLGQIYDVTYSEKGSRVPFSIGLAYAYQMDTARNKHIIGNMNADSLKMKWKDSEAENRAIERALKVIGSNPKQMSMEIERSQYQLTDPLRRIDTERFRKFAVAIACLIFFFIGAPLGAIIRKGGLGTPVIISLLFFVLYWVVDISGKKLSRQGAMSPFVGAFISSMVLLPIGVFLTIESTKDSSIFNPAVFFGAIGKSIKEFFAHIKRRKIKIVFMGTPEFAVGSLEALRKKGYNICAVVTTPDKPSGRGRKVNESAVKKYAVAHKIEVLQPVSLKDPEFIGKLESYKAELFVVVAFRMLPEAVWKIPRLGTFNLHASLLPQFRGAAPINWAIMDGERLTGVTTFMIDKNIDTGNILMQRECMIEKSDTAGSLHDKLMALGCELVVQTAEDILRHKAMPMPQTCISALRPAPKLNAESCRMEFRRSAKELELQVRGLSPYPAAHATLVTSMEGSEPHREEVKVYLAYEDKKPGIEGIGNMDGSAGTIATDGHKYLYVRCGDGNWLRIDELQVSGKRRLKTPSFLAGFRTAENSRFE
ncbi:MAG: methionyl-tRNA formyltransferase [Bacteroidales bacterium]|jgi:lipopolysaccharide export system permease protein|nr:methionyl-tRNA formyltransferase [Bacteroidales bacterium]MCI2122515.1 methionyl-tRNA formyltransferase [Bacteroidales bacterium]MCI2146247.1 methionyl-tRNA formyltransferase [Bacteroidales bacterium]